LTQSLLQHSAFPAHALPSARHEAVAPAPPASPLELAPGVPPAVALPAKTSGERLASFVTNPAPLEEACPAVASTSPPSPLPLTLVPDAPPHAATIAAATTNSHPPLMITMLLDLGWGQGKGWTELDFAPSSQFLEVARVGAGHWSDRWPVE
jgi:hypothetical protein